MNPTTHQLRALGYAVAGGKAVPAVDKPRAKARTDAGRGTETFVLPYPPSANRYWRNVRGRMLVSAAARAFKRTVAMKYATARPFAGEIRVELHVHRPRRAGDLDNYCKVVCDSLNGLAWGDDSQIAELHVLRYDGTHKGGLVIVHVESTAAIASAAGKAPAAARGEP